MSSQFTEIEIKLYVPDLEAVAARLTAAGAELTAPRIFERNVRYDDPQDNLSRRRQVLRLREDSRVRLTYKEEDGTKISESGARSRFEAEVTVSDFDVMHTILLRLNYRPYMMYEKYRTTYMLSGVEVTLDEMPYGNFVEIEGPDQGIQQAMQVLNLEDAPRLPQGYALLFDIVRRNLKLNFTDLTFKNFEGIKVPLSAFTSQERDR